jgi:hypothetical protein
MHEESDSLMEDIQSHSGILPSRVDSPGEAAE